jgi:hypothetical protein
VLPAPDWLASGVRLLLDSGRGCSDQVPAACKTADSFFPGFWDGTGWGFWLGGLGTDFFVDPHGRVGVLLTQVEMGKDMWPLVDQFQSLHETS